MEYRAADGLQTRAARGDRAPRDASGRRGDPRPPRRPREPQGVQRAPPPGPAAPGPGRPPRGARGVLPRAGRGRAPPLPPGPPPPRGPALHPRLRESRHRLHPAHHHLADRHRQVARGDQRRPRVHPPVPGPSRDRGEGPGGLRYQLHGARDDPGGPPPLPRVRLRLAGRGRGPAAPAGRGRGRRGGVPRGPPAVGLPRRPAPAHHGPRPGGGTTSSTATRSSRTGSSW